MNKHLWNAVHELLDAAQYAEEVLDNYSDVVDGEDGQPEPNKAMSAIMSIRHAVENTYLLMPKEPKA